MRESVGCVKTFLSKRVRVRVGGMGEEWKERKFVCWNEEGN